MREIRNNGRVIVDVRGRAFICSKEELSATGNQGRQSRQGGAAPPASPAARRVRSKVPSEIDLHGFTVEQALERAAYALDEALLADLQQLRLIHGKSGGRIRSALHGWLKAVPSVRSFGIDPQNEGVTIVRL